MMCTNNPDMQDINPLLEQMKLHCLHANKSILPLSALNCPIITAVTYHPETHALMPTKQGMNFLHRLIAASCQNGITIYACYVRFIAKSGSFTVERHVALYRHIPLYLRWLLRTRYQVDGVYIDFCRR